MVKFYDSVLPLFTPRPGDQVDAAYHFIYRDGARVIATDGVKLISVPDHLLEGKYQTYVHFPFYRKLLFECNNRMTREMVYFHRSQLAEMLADHNPTSVFFPQIQVWKDVFHYQHLEALLQVANVRATERIYLRTLDAGAAAVFTVDAINVVIMPGIKSDISEIRIISLSGKDNESYEQKADGSAAG